MAEEDCLHRVLEPFDCFRSDGGLQSRLSEIITSGWAARDVYGKELDGGEWLRLGDALARYLQGRLDADGYLSKGQRDAIAALAKSGKKLSTHITKVEAVKADWFLDFELNDQALDQEAWKAFSKVLDALSKLAPETPHAPPARSDKRPGSDARYLVATDILRSQLQMALDHWWLTNTDLPKDVDDAAPTPYGEFLAALFGRIKLSAPPGSSSTAVQAARKLARDQDKAAQKQGNDLAAKLASVVRSTKHGARIGDPPRRKDR